MEQNVIKLNFSELSPSKDFNELVHCYWKFTIPKNYNNGLPFNYILMPENTVSIVFANLPHYQGPAYSAVRTKGLKEEIFPGSILLGIKFNPWVNVETLFDEKLKSINQIVKCSKDVQSYFEEIIPSQLEEAFTEKEFIERGLQRLVSHHQVQFDPLVKYICLQLSQHDKTVNEITKDIPMSIRPIQKHFKKITGLTMVEFRNIERLRASSKKIFYNKKGLSDTALEHGFTDHAHFIHSFQKYMLDVSMKTILAQTEIMNFNFAK